MMGIKEFFKEVFKIMFPKKVKWKEREGVIGHYDCKPFHNFRYALTTSSSSCTTGLITNGNFKGKQAGDKVIHNVFGEGIVVNVNGKIATIAFSHKFGIKQIAINHKYLTKK